jgi:DNA-binding MarR family transcriptional regulator
MLKPKLKISANEVLTDIRSGMDDDTLMKKYKLNFRQLQRLFRKMIQGGFISPIELAQRLCVTKSQVTDAINMAERAIEELD